MKTKQSTNSSELIMEKGYFLLYDFFQFHLIQFFTLVGVKYIVISLDIEQIVNLLELFYNGSFINSLILFIPYTFVVDFYMPTFSIGGKILGIGVKYSKDISIMERLKYSFFKLVDTVIAPTRIFVAFLFSKFSPILFCEKYTEVYLTKIINKSGQAVNNSN